MAADTENPNFIIYRDKDGATTTIPARLMKDVPIEDKESRAMARLGLAVGGVGIICSLAIGVGNLLKTCSTENMVWYVIGYPPSSLLECAQLTLTALPHWLRNLW